MVEAALVELLRVFLVFETRDDLRDVLPPPGDDVLREAVVQLAERRGTVAIVDGRRRVVGVLTAGDLTRLMERERDFMELRVDTVMNRTPKLARDGELGSAVVYRMQQFGVQFYQASLSASDIDKLVRFEVLSYGERAQPVRGRRKGLPPPSKVNWDLLERRIASNDKAYQRQIIRRKIDELAAYYRECKEAATLPAIPGAVIITSEKRFSQLPNVPTFVESGYNDLVTGSWYAVWVPAKTPEPIVSRLNTVKRIDTDLAEPEPDLERAKPA